MENTNTQNPSNARPVNTSTSDLMLVADTMQTLFSQYVNARALLLEIHDSLDTDPNDGNRAVLPAELAKRIEDFLK